MMQTRHRLLRGVAALGVASMTLVVLASPASAQGSDDRAGAVPLPNGGAVSGDTIGATQEAGEIASACARFWSAEGGQNTVWYSLEVVDPSGFTLTLSSPTDHGIAVYDAMQEEVACDDDEVGGVDEVVEIGGTPGTYFVSVAPFLPNEAGPYTLTVSSGTGMTGPTPPGVNPPPEDCFNGVDDDGDGLVDGDDPDCGSEPVEICDNGVDDDGDGEIDELDCVPPAEVPEAPFAVLLPLSTGIVLAGGLLVRRRMRRTAVAA